jgi:hypothetical protein
MFAKRRRGLESEEKRMQDIIAKLKQEENERVKKTIAEIRALDVVEEQQVRREYRLLIEALQEDLEAREMEFMVLRGYYEMLVLVLEGELEVAKRQRDRIFTPSWIISGGSLVGDM